MVDPLLVLHLSDLQFGKNSRFCDANPPANEPEDLADRLHTAIGAGCQAIGSGEQVHLVVVTGDIAEWAKPAEYKVAERFLGRLAGQLGLPRSHFVVVPGNHDVSWRACRRAEEDVEDGLIDETELRPRMDATKLAHYDSFLTRFWEDTPPPRTACANGAFVYDYTDLGVSIAALNSCEQESHRDEDHHGQLSEAQLQSVLRHWRTGDDSMLRLVALHHNLTPATDASVRDWLGRAESQGIGLSGDDLRRFAYDIRGLKGKDMLERFCEHAEAWAVLHGHQHETMFGHLTWPISGRTSLVLGAGSTGLREGELPRNQPNCVTLVVLDRGARSVACQPLRYEATVTPCDGLQPGTWTRDPRHQNGYRPACWSPPIRAQATSARRAPTSAPSVHSAFVAEYRARMSGRFESLDLKHVGVAQEGGTDRPIDPRLDELYIPLRFDSEIGARQTGAADAPDPGHVLSVEDLVRRERSLIVRGPAGAGKTTWLKHTFRRMLRDDSALPFTIELRGVARCWSERAKGQERCLDSYLHDAVAEHLGPGWRDAGARFLEDPPAHVRPVLLVDGWDELGGFGEEFREKLAGFMEAHPDVLVIATSRPSGGSQPTHAHGFETLDVLPLSDEEITGFAPRFFAACYAGEQSETDAASAQFAEALGRAPEARELARTPLMLTMMLMVSRSHPLPDRRHRLYKLVVEHLLSALPERRAEGGAQDLPRQWRPDDPAERLRACAGLAYGLQTGLYARRARQAAVGTRDEFVEHLPPEWSDEQRHGFVLWLTGPSGILTDRADGTHCFWHLSFQEYLTAWHLKAACEGDARVQRFSGLANSREWWETLRLWAALVGDDAPARWDPILSALVADAHWRFWLAGAMLADGVGTDAVVDRWIAGLATALGEADLHACRACAWAWRATRQIERRASVLDAARRAAESATWLGWHRWEAWLLEAEPVTEVPLPGSATALAVVLTSRRGQVHDGRSVAVARALWGTSPLFCGGALALSFLRAWPSERVLLGQRVQLAVTLGLDPTAVGTVAGALRAASLRGERDSDGLPRLARTAVPDLVASGGWSRAMARDVCLEFARGLARDYASSALRGFAPRRLRRALAMEASDQLSGWDAMRAYVMPDGRGCDVADEWIRDALSLSPCLLAAVDLVRCERLAVWSYGTRAFVAHAPGPDPTPETALLSAACMLSLHRDGDSAPFERALAEHGPTVLPLWVSLAKHLARRSDDDDRALLIDAVRNPEQFAKDDQILAWGIQYWVRGDVMFEDGSVVTLDELLGEELLYLDDMEDELEIGWDAEEPAG